MPSEPPRKAGNAPFFLGLALVLLGVGGTCVPVLLTGASLGKVGDALPQVVPRFYIEICSLLWIIGVFLIVCSAVFPGPRPTECPECGFCVTGLDVDRCPGCGSP